ncbi:hypothetical protein Daus18300_004914 [Diaporthe australafricana]|uniref:Ecp2 effector protein domain-containing protein n=1 Tax=Diaporthe australafricana TaxID=127596 RepID=A0ABR3X5Y6_9PEZI
MRSITTVITFVVAALFFIICTAAPQPNSPRDIASTVIDFISTSTIPDNSTANGTATVNSANQCYNYGTSEKWKDVGGQDSDYVNQAIYALCTLIAIDAYKRAPAGYKYTHCQEVRAGTEDRKYDRSIVISLKYRGPVLAFEGITAGYCNDRMAQPKACGAGGEFDKILVPNPSLPSPWTSDRWEVKADPNRGDCRSNGYNSDL